MTATTNKRVSIIAAKRSGNFRRKVIDGVHCCIDCEKPMDNEFVNFKPIRCGKCRSRLASYEAMKQQAHTLVAAEIRHGNISHPSEHKCVDCGRDAECYDHRDYANPLYVQPVCFSCNIIRGPAVQFELATNGRLRASKPADRRTVSA